MTISDGRWPPVYNADDLLDTIKKLLSNGDLFRRFYSGSVNDPEYCQGDILNCKTRIPCLDENVRPAAMDNNYEYWLVIGNTCDLYREMEDVLWTQIVPIYKVDTLSEIKPEKLNILQSYKYSRSFYLPPWNSKQKNCYVADFTRPITISKLGLSNMKKICRLEQYSWALLNACLVRFLARDDGRFD